MVRPSIELQLESALELRRGRRLRDALLGRLLAVRPGCVLPRCREPKVLVQREVELVGLGQLGNRLRAHLHRACAATRAVLVRQ
eukprot:scaffold37173_cov69-Phaeocystis_antarctica.AAC.5